MADKPLKIIAPPSYRQKLSRRALFQIGGAAAGLAIVGAACGSDKKSSSTSGTTAGTTGSTTAATTAETTAATTAGSTAGTTAGTTGATVAAGDKETLLKNYSNVVNKSSGSLSMYTWGEYNDPDIVGALAESTLGVTMTVDYYTSNEDLIAKLTAASGSGGYDIVVPTGPYIPQMLQLDLLEKFDKSKLPNMVNVDPLYLKQSWDPGNDYSVCKDWGSTGWLYDTTKHAEIKTWADFIKVAQTTASGDMSMLDTPANVAGMYFWANGINWNTEKKEDLDACEKFLVDEFASHIKAFDSYPSTKIGEGAYSLSMMWNGDARQAMISNIPDGGGNPDDWKWGLGAPATELWMDNYCIAKGAPNADAAHAWINWILSPEVSIKDLEYHGYNSGMKDIDKLIATLTPELERGDMIFFDETQVKSMQVQVLNTSNERLVAIFNAVKAKAGS